MPKTQTTKVPTTAPAQRGSGKTEREFTVKERSQWQMILRRFSRHRLAMGSLIVLLLLVARSRTSVRSFWHYSATDDHPGQAFRTSPSLAHPLGTDDAGHDYLARVLRGAQQSLKIAAIVALLSTRSALRTARSAV